MKPAVGIGGALTLLEAGDFIAARQQLLEVARTQVAWIGEDFQGSYPLHPYMTGAERTEVLDWYRTARAEYYVDMETGAVQFDDQPKPVESRPGDDGLGRRGCGAVVTEEEALKLVSRSLQVAEVYGERAAQAGLHDNWGRADRAREKAEKLGDELRQLIRGLTRTATSWKDSGSERETMALGLPRGVIDRAVPLVSRSDPDPVPAEGVAQMLRVVHRMADSRPIRRLDQALFGKGGKGMARVTSGRAIEVSIEWGEDDDALTVADIIEFGERLKKGRTPRDAKAKVEWELVDGKDQYKLTVKGN